MDQNPKLPNHAAESALPVLETGKLVQGISSLGVLGGPSNEDSTDVGSMLEPRG